MPGKHQRSYVLQLTDAPKRRLKFDLFAKVAFKSGGVEPVSTCRRYGVDAIPVSSQFTGESFGTACRPSGHANRFSSPQHGAEGAAGTDSAIKA